jgi:mRNA-degrading endonuclease RelE of RelBE toxin-antitoxin system
MRMEVLRFVKSRRTKKFNKDFEGLPLAIQKKAEKAYRKWKNNPYDRSLQFKPMPGIASNAYSVKIDDDYRAIGYLNGDTIFWDFIGSHADYNHYF